MFEGDCNAEKGLDNVDVSHIRVSWSSETIRFSKKLRLIDIQDCLMVVYGSVGSAKTAQSKYFSANLLSTEKKLDCDEGKLVTKVKWSDSARVRVAADVKFMKIFFEKVIKMPRAVDVASLLNTDLLAANMVNVTESDHRRKKRKGTVKVESDTSIIYKLIYLPTGKCVYVGRTKDPDRRLSQHASKGSKCRLVCNAFRKYGRKSFGLEPILRCHLDDADTNESFWIIQCKTMYPEGYNLRHGRAAGEEQESSSSALIPVCTGVVPFDGFSDEANACAEGWADVAEIARDVEIDSNNADELCRNLLRQVHPDRNCSNGRVYTTDEVAAMLNTIREAL